MEFVKEEIIQCFGPPRTIVSDNATCFKPALLGKFMSEHGTAWKTVLAYAPMCNGRAERMIGTLKRAVRKVIIGLGQQSSEWEPALSRVVHGDRRRPLHGGCSPFQLLYGVLPKMTPSDRAPLFPAADLSHKEMELMYTKALRTNRVKGQSEPAAPIKGKIIRFNVSDEVLVAIGRSIGDLAQWPPFTSRLYGPRRIARARHPRYMLVLQLNRYSRENIHARRLVLYKKKPLHLKKEELPVVCILWF